MGELIPRDPQAAASANEDPRTAVRSTVGDVRRLVYDLRPPALDELGLVGAVKEHAARLEDDGDLRVTVEAPEGLSPLPAAVEVAAYRVVQEALTNVSRHARARWCVVQIAHDRPVAALRAEVEDDGQGMGGARGTGVGLHSMRERAEELGGRCVVGPAPEGGTRVRADLPLRATDGPGVGAQ